MYSCQSYIDAPAVVRSCYLSPTAEDVAYWRAGKPEVELDGGSRDIVTAGSGIRCYLFMKGQEALRAHGKVVHIQCLQSADRVKESAAVRVEVLGTSEGEAAILIAYRLKLA